MPQIGRNDPCPCESGKKYKKCCFHNDKPERFDSFFKKNNSVELLKVFSLLQLIPENHSKIVRLESIINLILINLNENKSLLNYNLLQSVIHKDFEFDHREDPSENSFTENIMFENGNNIVFPGIAHESTNINQHLINSIFFKNNDLSKSYREKANEGVLFLLHVFDKIALKLGYSRYLFEDDYRSKITFPEKKFIDKFKDLFVFSRETLNKIYQKLNIKTDIIKEFSIKPEKAIINEHGQSDLLEKPFLKIGETYYLVLPSTQNYCLNQFLIKNAKKFNEYKLLENSYDNVIRNELGKYLNLFWSKRSFKIDLNKDESIWSFDKNKFAYVCYLSENSKKHPEQRANQVIKKVRAKLNVRDTEFIALHVVAAIDTSKPTILSFKLIRESKYQFPVSVFNLFRVKTTWEIDELAIWKYLKAKDRAEKNSVLISPEFSILTYFKYFKNNKGSFFQPDRKTPDFLVFNFAVQGEIIINNNQKNDKHLTQLIDKYKGLVYVPVFKSETHAPIYTSEEIFNGNLRVVLEKYSCPIWVRCNASKIELSRSFIDCVLYWLNELHDNLKLFINQLGEFPLSIVLEIEQGLLEEETSDKENNNRININYQIDRNIREITLKVPRAMYVALNREDNYGERILIATILKSISNFLKFQGIQGLSEKEIDQLILELMPLSEAKIIITSNIYDDYRLEGDYIPRPRYIYDSDTSIILEENVNWLLEKKEIPKEINSKTEKIELCNSLINSLIEQIRSRLKKYNSKKLLKHLMLRHESLLNEQGHLDLIIVTRLACFSKYENVKDKYKKNNSKLVKSLHSIRSLIEFVVAEPYYGNKIINNDDCDFMLALMVQIFNYGTIKDSIKFDLDDPKMGLLDSGRIGISHDFYDTTIQNYHQSTTEDEITQHKEYFDRKYKSKVSGSIPREKDNADKYLDKVDAAFEEELGVNFTLIYRISVVLNTYCFSKNQSFYCFDEKEFIKTISKEAMVEEKSIVSFLNLFCLKTRGKIDKPQNENDYPEIFPWRYNRKLSYIRKPIIKIRNESKGYDIYWSARHIRSAIENFYSLFYNGLLKVENENKKVWKLISQRNIIKGREFRNEVYEWLINNTSLRVEKFEVKIKEKGVFNADRNYGDIDIIAFDKNEKIIYSIECKNTKQVKIMYDYHNDLKNYINKQIPKHLNREQWLKHNIEKVKNHFNLQKGLWEVKSIVISSSQLPIKFIYETPFPFYSLNEIKRNQLFS